MKIYIKFAIILLSISLMFCSKENEQKEFEAGIYEEEIEYKAGGEIMKGFLAYDKSLKEKRPGILIVHEWWSHNDFARERARKLAELGYTTFAIDMYGNGKQADHPDDAGKFAEEVMKNMNVARTRFMAGYNLLRTQPTVDYKNIAAIGYCFGGGVVLQMARLGLEINGIVSFHGSLTTNNPALPGRVQTPILVCNGEDDPFVTPEQIQAFKDEMINAKANFEFVSYPDAKHSFTNPDADKYAEKFGLPLAYNKKADVQSWRDMKEFFKMILNE